MRRISVSSPAELLLPVEGEEDGRRCFSSNHNEIIFDRMASGPPKKDNKSVVENRCFVLRKFLSRDSRARRCACHGTRSKEKDKKLLLS